LTFIINSRHAAPGQGINGWGIDTRRNRILLMIEEAETLPSVTRWVQGLDIPCRLVAVDVVGPISLSQSQAYQGTRSRHRSEHVGQAPLRRVE
jgi:hypothetical protein